VGRFARTVAPAVAARDRSRGALAGRCRASDLCRGLNLGSAARRKGRCVVPPNGAHRGYAMEIVGKKSQGLSVTALKDDKTVIISFNDRSLNFYVTDSLKESLKETINSKIEDGFQHFVLNLDNVKIIDSCGVGLIIVANNVTSSRNTKLYLSNIKPFIIKIFEIMRISKHLSIFDREDDALQAIKAAK
jgi:anti-sigma B factor antagonist